MLVIYLFGTFAIQYLQITKANQIVPASKLVYPQLFYAETLICLWKTTSMDKVFIKGLELYTLIGVYDFERDARQRIVIDLELTHNLRAAGISDDVADTLDYGAIAERLANIADTATYQLIEALGAEMIDTVMREYAPLSATITIHKPDILKNVSTVGITLTRAKNDYVSSDTASNLRVNDA